MKRQELYRRFVCGLFLCGLILPAWSAVYKFDMGTERSAVWDGFTQVTKESKYTKEKGFGWKEVSGLKDAARGPSSSGGLLRPDDLCGDFVTDAKEPFLLDLSDGVYRVYVILGDIGDIWFYPSKTLWIKGNGKEKYREDITAENFFTEKYFFRSMKKEWRKEDQLWEKWIEPAFAPIEFEVEVRDGQLELQFSPTCRITCLIVYPVSETALVAREIEEITAKRKESFLDKYYEDQSQDLSSWQARRGQHVLSLEDSFLPTEIQKKKGYVLFQRNSLSMLSPKTKPVSEEIGSELRLFVAKGESKPAMVCVLPFKDLKDGTVQCTDLVDETGNVLASSSILLRRVIYSPSSFFMVSDRNSWQVVAKFLTEEVTTDYEEGVCRGIWINVIPPIDAKPGLYSGKIVFSAKNVEPEEVVLKVRVLPFSLADMPDDVAFGFYYYLPDWWTAYFRDQEQYWEMARKELLLMQQNNFTSALAGISLPPVKMKDGKVVVEFEGSDLDRFLNLKKELGMRAPFCWYHYTNNLLATCRKLLKIPDTYDFRGPEQFDNPELREMMKSVTIQIEEYRKKKNFPRIYYYLQDEYGAHYGQKGVDWAKRITSIYHEIPMVPVIGGICNKLETQMIPLYDVSLINPAVLDADTMEKMRTSGKETGFYNIGRDRLSNGFYLWKTGAKIKMEWIFSTRGLVDPYNTFDRVDLTIAFPSLEGPVPVKEIEIMREGLDDYRYCVTLDLLIKKAEKSGKREVVDQAKKARGTLEGIMAMIRPDFQWYVKEGSFPSNDVYDKLRWRIAQEIMRLEAIMK